MSGIMKQKQVYAIFSVDTEHDIIRRYATTSAGWSKGIPLLFDVFDAARLKSKVCWLIEYTLKDGIVAANPASEFYVKEFSDLIAQIKSREDELGLHPSMADWLGGEKHVPISLYNSPELWDITRRYHDPGFVSNLITSATKEFIRLCGVHPVGCRTGGCQYATHLGTALLQNEILIDSSVPQNRMFNRVVSPNIYYADGDDIRLKSNNNSSVLEIPSTCYIDYSIFTFFLRLRTWYLLRLKKPIFLSFYIHNWQAITPDGKPNQRFLDFLMSTLRFLSRNGVHFLRWDELKEIHNYLS